MRYHLHFAKEGCSLPDGIHFLHEIKPRFSLPSAADMDDIVDSDMDIECEMILPIAETDVQPVDSAKGRSRVGRSSPDA